MATTYSTNALVASLLQVPAFSGATKPTSTEVDAFINRAEDWVDRVTGHAWRANLTPDYEYHDLNRPYTFSTGIPIPLEHRQIRTPLTAASGDSLQVWQGNTWEEWVNVKTEARNGDFWVQERDGILRLLYWNFFAWPVRIRIKYRYGAASVDKGIEDIVTKKAAIDILTSRFKSTIVAETPQSVRLDTLINMWREDIERELLPYKELKVAAR